MVGVEHVLRATFADRSEFRDRDRNVVHDHAHGFTVEAPVARIVDLGTRFDARVDQDGGMDLRVVEGEVRLWDLERAFVIARWGAHEGPVTGLAFLDKSARLVSGGGDGVGRVWDLYTLLSPSPLEARANEPEALEVLGGRRLEGARLEPSSSARLLLYRQ